MGRVSVAAAVAAVTLALASPAHADPGGLQERSGVVLDVPLLDAPFNFKDGFTWPAMGQSLALSTDFYQLVHNGVGRLIDPYDPITSRRILGRVAVTLADVLVTNLPGGLIWAHNEGQRAVLGRHGISSFNDVYRFNVVDPTIYASHVSDDELRELKSKSQGDFVRRSTAGIEMNLQLVTSLEKNQLFYATRTWNQALYWQSYLLVSGYQLLCASKRADRITDEALDSGREQNDASRRDMSGLDCLAWTHDQFNPTLPFTSDARGLFRGGNGVQRYVLRRQMSGSEKDHLTQQAVLSLLNVFDPALFGFDAFSVRVGAREQELRFNGHIRHTPTAYGQAINLEVYSQYGDINTFMAVQGGFNGVSFFPGLAAELHRFPLDLVIGLPISLSARASVWLQPKDQRFDESHHTPGVLGALRLAYSSSRSFEPYLEFEGKSAGWVASHAYLGANASVRAGLVAMLF